jgi:phospholipid/cholesterol/gamma-HCH transport system ATP-binding protein
MTHRGNCTLPRTLIELREVNFAIEGRALLKNINLQLHEGESLALIGPSGSGKSLLLKLMAGLIEPTGGEIFDGGRPRSSLSPAERLEWSRRQSMLFQRNALFDSMSSLENVIFSQVESRGRDLESASRRATTTLEAVGLAHAANLYPDEISGGMQKRLGIARAIALEPELIFYDDPTAGLDPITSRKIIVLIRELQMRAGGARSTIVVVTNEMARAYQVADRIAFMDRGELLVTGTVSETQAHIDPRVRQFIRGETEGRL